MDQTADDQARELVRAVRSQAEIVSLVSEHTKLVRKGKDYVGCCPFNKCETGCFRVKPKTGVFACSRCGECGDVFEFVERMNGVGLTDALKYLARRYEIASEQTLKVLFEKLER